MLLTEDEACRRWCPFARLATEHVDLTGSRTSKVAPNRVIARGLEFDPKSGEPKPVHIQDWLKGAECLASQCMAWRAVEDGRGYCGAFRVPVQSGRERSTATSTQHDT